MDSAERNFHIAIEAILDVGSFLISKKGWPVPSKYSEIGITLAENGVISQDEGRALSSLAGLRNILVHSYSEIDHEIIFSLLNRVEEIEDLMGKLLKYME